MGSLSAHLRAPEDHARLSFHPDCPVCRSERLTGLLPPAGVVSLRTQAVLAAGVLAFSAAAPAAVLAAEPDQEQQGATAPGQSGGADTAGNPDFDPGGASTELPADAPPVPQLEAPPGSNSGLPAVSALPNWPGVAAPCCSWSGSAARTAAGAAAEKASTPAARTACVRSETTPVCGRSPVSRSLRQTGQSG